MSVGYQALLGDTSIDAGFIMVDSVDANTVKVEKTLSVVGDLIIPTGATNNYVLTCDAFGDATWQPSNPILAGDCTGNSSSNVVTSLRGGTVSIPVTTDTVVCKNTIDSLNNKSLISPTLVGTMMTSSAGMTLTQIGDSLGSSSLFLCNRTGTNGAQIQQKNITIDLCDLGLFSQASAQTGTIRMEKRSANMTNSANSTNGELQLKPNTTTAASAFSVGEVISTFNSIVSIANKLSIGTISFLFPSGGATQSYTLPAAFGSTGQVLSATSTGAMSWVTALTGLTGGVTTSGSTATVVTNANLTGMVTSVGNATTVVTNANLTGDVTSVGNATTVGNAAVIGKVLTGFVSGAGTVTASDTVLSAIQKLNANDATNANLTGMVTSVGNATTVVTNANLTGMVTSVGNATTVVTNANLTGMVTSAGNATTVVTNANLTGECTSSGNATTLTNSAVIGKLLTGFTGVAGVIAATDSILSFANKIVGNLAALITTVGTPTSANTLNQIVKRDGTTGGFTAGNITAQVINAAAITGTSLSSSGGTITGGAITGSSLLSTGTVTANQTVSALSYTAPTAQGAFMGWNRDGASGRALFGNQRGLGAGGFEWVNYNSTNTILTPTPSMLLDASGNLTLGGGLTCNGIGQTLTGTWTQNSTFWSNGTIYLNKVGNNVTMMIPGITINAIGTGTIVFTTSLPSAWLPNATAIPNGSLTFAVNVISAGGFLAGILSVAVTGGTYIQISPIGQFTTGTTSGWNHTSVSWFL